MPQGLVAINGEIRPLADSQVPVLDRGFLYGEAIFETILALKGHLIDGLGHLERLRRSADLAGIEIPWSHEELAFEATTLAGMIGSPRTQIRLIVTGGDGWGLSAALSRPRRVTVALPAPVEDPQLFVEGLILHRKSSPVSTRGPTPKSNNYLHSAAALREVRTHGGHDVLWSNDRGELTECTTSNIFLIGRRGDGVEILTPALSSGLLDGITRRRVLQLLSAARIAAHEQIVFVDEIARFDEGFLCSTVRGLVPIRQIDNHRMHSARGGSVFRQVERLYSTWLSLQSEESQATLT